MTTQRRGPFFLSSSSQTSTVGRERPDPVNVPCPATHERSAVSILKGSSRIAAHSPLTEKESISITLGKVLRFPLLKGATFERLSRREPYLGICSRSKLLCVTLPQCTPQIQTISTSTWEPSWSGRFSTEKIVWLCCCIRFAKNVSQRIICSPFSHRSERFPTMEHAIYTSGKDDVSHLSMYFLSCFPCRSLSGGFLLSR